MSFVQPTSQNSYSYGQPGHPPWHHFTSPRRRSPDIQNYNDPYQSYNHYSHSQNPYQGPQNYREYPQAYDTRSSVDLINLESRNNQNDGRLLSESAFTRISETLGAINTVGHYLVDIVNDNERNESDPNLQQLPQALYTISKNVLGRNVTDKIAPIVKKALPKVLPDAPITRIATGDLDRNDAKACTTPEGEEGVCEDLSNCPQLLLNLVNLRESLCFKDLFVPGVCCPRDGVVLPTQAIEKPVISTTSKPTYLVPVTTQRPIPRPTARPTTTKKPSAILVLTTKRPRPTSRPTTTTTFRPTTTSPSTTTTRIPSTTSYYTPSFIANYSNIVDVNGNFLFNPFFISFLPHSG